MLYVDIMLLHTDLFQSIQKKTSFATERREIHKRNNFYSIDIL